MSRTRKTYAQRKEEERKTQNGSTQNGAQKKKPDGVIRVDEKGDVQSYIPVIREFTNKETGQRYLYCYDQTDVVAIQNAETVFRYREDQEAHPPINLRLLEDSLGGQYMIEAFQHLLIERNADGSLVPYDEMRARETTRQFVMRLKGKDWNTLRECRRDFFIMAELQDNESLGRIIRSNKSAIELKQVQIKALQIAGEISKQRGDLLDFMSLESLSAEYEKLKTTDLHGSSQATT